MTIHDTAKNTIGLKSTASEHYNKDNINVVSVLSLLPHFLLFTLSFLLLLTVFTARVPELRDRAVSVLLPGHCKPFIPL